MRESSTKLREPESGQLKLGGGVEAAGSSFERLGLR